MTNIWILLTLSPVVELRGGIPYGIMQGVDLRILLPVCILLNSLIYFPIAFLLYRGIDRIGFISRYVNNVRERGKKYVDKYGFGGLLLFVAVPLPFTGVYTATILSYVFNMPVLKSYLSMLLGCCISAGITVAITLGAINL